MDELAALDVVAARAVETTDRERVLWSDADREWAGRVAAEAVGQGADGEAYVARRAQLVLERLGARQPALARAVRGLRWRPWVGWAIPAGALVFGIAIDRVGGNGRINLLAPPFFGLLLWNLLIYLWLLVRFISRRGRPGPVRALLVRLAGERHGGGRSRDGRETGEVLRGSLAALSVGWARLAAPLYSLRAARILHLAAALTALGVIAGMYTRGLAFEYRATWESTFLDASDVRGLLVAGLALGSWLTGIPIPAADALEAIRAPASENAGPWLHLFAVSLVAGIVVPRLLLASGAALFERRRAGHLRLPLSEPYFRRLLSNFAGGPARLWVIPYSYAPSAEALAGLKAIVARALGSDAVLVVEDAVAWGDDEASATLAAAAEEGAVALLFNLTATPEREAHGVFLDALRARLGTAGPLVALLDEAAFRARWPGDEARLAARRAAWRELLADYQVPAVSVDLVAPDLAAADDALHAALAGEDAGEAAGGGPS